MAAVSVSPSIRGWAAAVRRPGLLMSLGVELSVMRVGVAASMTARPV